MNWRMTRFDRPIDPAYIPAPLMISWSDWPARRRPFISLLAAGVIGLVVATIATIDPWLAVLGTALLLGVCSEALLPTRFTVTDEGIQVDSVFRKGHKPWERIATWQPCRHGFLLRGTLRVGRLRHRDLWLRCPEHIDTIEARLHSHLGAPAETPT